MAAGLNGAIVIDTNIVLDLALPLHHALVARSVQWVATCPMREELVRVLAYPQIVKSLNFRGRTAEDVLVQWDALALLQPASVKAPVTCKDPDDQKFIDLAVAHRALLLSKDHAVLCMRKRLAALGVAAQAAI
jgi:predicted nucleic acid-binding protein